MSSPHFNWVLPAVVVATIAISTIAGTIMNAGARAEASEGKPATAWRMAQAAEPKKQRSEASGSQSRPPDTKKKQAAAEPARPEADRERGVPAGQLLPQVHASNGGITTCFDALARASSQAVDGEHQAFSFWDQRRPNEGTFRSIVSLRYPHATAPRGASVIINSPVSGACDATTLQIMPTLRTCNAIQGDLMKNGRAVANLAGLALIQLPEDLSYLLLPTAGDGCTIVAIRVIQSR